MDCFHKLYDGTPVNGCFQEYCEGTEEKATVPSTVLLVMSRLCYDLDQSTIGYLVNLNALLVV